LTPLIISNERLTKGGKVSSYYPDDLARDRRLAAIRAKRGTPERLAQIEAMQQAKSRARKLKASASSGRKTPENSTDIYKHSWSEWFQMRDAGFECIGEFARRREPPSYGEIWSYINAHLGKDLGNPLRQLPNLLGYISECGYEQFKILPTALVLHQEGDQHPGPGPGFFRLAANMGLLPEDQAPPVGEEWTGMTDAQRAFWDASVEAVFNHFANSPNQDD
jgi:hypothetical protein